MRKLIAILISISLLALVGCANQEKQASSIEGATFKTNNNVVIEQCGMGFDDEKPYICIDIKNKSDQHTVIYGQEYYILKDGERLTPTGTVAWEDIAYTVKAGGTGNQIIYLDGYALKDNETYRLVKCYHIEGSSESFVGYIDFQIDRSEVKGSVLTPIYAAWLHNEANGFNDVPTYLLGEDNILYSDSALNQPNVIKNWYEACKLEEFKVTKDDFKGLSEGNWLLKGCSIEKIIEENQAALRHIEDDYGNFEYFLKQKNGVIYYVKGWSGVDGLYQILIMDVK